MTASPWVLTAIGDGASEAQPDPRYSNGAGLFGGWTAGLLMSAVLAQPECATPPASVTVTFLRRIEERPARVATRLLRRTRNTEFWRVEATQNDVLCAEASLVCARHAPERETAIELARPAAPPPETVPVALNDERAPPFVKMVDIRGCEGVPPSNDFDRARTVFWQRDALGRPLSYPMLALLADFMPPRSLYRGGAMGAASTLSMSIYYRASEAEIGAVGSEPVLSSGAARAFSGGLYDHSLSIWSRAGVLLATSEQLAIYR